VCVYGGCVWRVSEVYVCMCACVLVCMGGVRAETHGFFVGVSMLGVNG